MSSKAARCLPILHGNDAAYWLCAVAARNKMASYLTHHNHMCTLSHAKSRGANKEGLT